MEREKGEAVDDFASKPATGASDKGAFDDFPLHKVAVWGDVEAAEVLLAHGADITARGADDDTPLHRALMGGHLEMMQFLLSRGANPDLRDIYGDSPRDHLDALALIKAMGSPEWAVCHPRRSWPSSTAEALPRIL